MVIFGLIVEEVRLIFIPQQENLTIGRTIFVINIVFKSSIFLQLYTNNDNFCLFYLGFRVTE